LVSAAAAMAGAGPGPVCVGRHQLLEVVVVHIADGVLLETYAVGHSVRQRPRLLLPRGLVQGVADVLEDGGDDRVALRLIGEGPILVRVDAEGVALGVHRGLEGAQAGESCDGPDESRTLAVHGITDLLALGRVAERLVAAYVLDEYVGTLAAGRGEARLESDNEILDNRDLDTADHTGFVL
jgi:hypothetical protein